MDIDFTTEQKVLSETITRLLRNDYAFPARQKSSLSRDGWNREFWSSLANEGFLNLLIPAELDGYGGSAVDAMIVMQAMGEALVLEPYLGTAIVAAPAIAEWGNAAQRNQLLPEMLEGRLTAAFAYAEGDGRESGRHLSTKAVPAGTAWRITGQKALVLGGSTADLLLIAAVAERGLGLFVVTADSPNVERTQRRLRDGSLVADVTLREAQAQSLRAPGSGVVEICVARALAGLVAEAVGTMTAAYQLTLEHLRTRQQFGRPLGALQALQHRVAEMLVSLELSRSMAMFAASAVSLKDQELRAVRLAQAKAVVGRHGKLIAEAAVQLHGGMGMVEEYPVGVCLKHLIAIEHRFGTTDDHLALLADKYEFSSL